MRKPLRLSLANKCQLLFGGAVILILTSALIVVWYRMELLVRERQEATARHLAEAWLSDLIQLGGSLTPIHALRQPGPAVEGLSLSLVEKEDFQSAGQADPLLAEAIERFESRTDRNEASRTRHDPAGGSVFRYVRAIRRSDLSRIRGGAAAGFGAGLDATAIADPLEMVLVVQLRDDLAQRQLLLNKVYLVAAGLLAGLLAIGVFWFITTRLVLQPVRVLRDTAEKVSEGDIHIRSEIATGDEFEQLSDMFNLMLQSLKLNQDQLKAINKSLDLKLGELAESNVALFEANRIKGEFLANVSHELRTPLNSIIGFAEVLEETLRDRTGPVDEKRKRYCQNIIVSSRRLLDLINDLLDLAKIEAGRIDLHVGPVSVPDVCEGLLNLMRPQAEKGQILLELSVQPDMPVLQTDAGKLQQVLFNFLSNAVKFTPSGGTVTLSAQTINGQGPRPGAPSVQPPTGDPAATTAPPTPPAPPPPPLRVRISVRDTGPGIALEDQERIFEKFTQLDPGVTKQHGGTGLGLTISRELARMLQAQITLDSDLGRGAVFSVILPLVLEQRSAPLMPSDDSPPRSRPPATTPRA